MSISNSALKHLFGNASDAIVVCFSDGTDAPDKYPVEYINQSALTLLGLRTTPPHTTPLVDLEPLRPLLTRMQALPPAGEFTSGSLPMAPTGQLLTYEITPLGEWLVIRLQATQPAETLATAIGNHLLATNHLAVALLDPIFNDSGQLIDFRLAAMHDGSVTADGPNNPLIGKLLSDWNPESKSKGLFDRYVSVMASGQSFRAEQYYPGINMAFDVAASRYGQQLLLTFSRTTETYRARQQVQQQAALLEAIMHSTQDYIAVYQSVRNEEGALTDFKGLLFSEVFARISNLPINTFLNVSLNELPTTTPALFSQYATLVETGDPFRAERSWVGPDSGTHWFDISASKLLDGFVTIGRDITAHKQSLQQVETQSQLLETILNNSDSFIYLAESVRDADGQIVDFRIARSNQAGQQNMIRTVGYDGTGSTVLTLYPFSRESGLFSRYCEVVDTGLPMTTDFEYHYGHIREWMKISAQKMGDGLVVTYVDVSAARQAAEKAERYAQQLKGVLDASPNGIILLEALRDNQHEITDFQYILANQMASKINGVPLEELIGNTLLTLFPSSKTSGSFPQNVHALTTGNPIRKQLKLLCDRMEGWYDFTSNRINENNLVVSFTDITDVKVLEERQRNLVDELTRSNANLQEFAYAASHDLQEPLRKIMSFGAMLKKSYAPLLGEEGADLITRMESASARMSALITDLLAYSRLTTQPKTLRPQALSQVIDNVLADLDNLIREREATVEVDNLFSVPGDSTQLTQVFQNLLTNALKFTKPGVQPAIRISSRLINRLELPAGFEPVSRQENYGLVRVMDNGIGFDPVHRERIFGTFQRLHGRGAYPGTGIGLAIAKKAVENHAGFIEADSQPGEGAVFTVYLPI